MGRSASLRVVEVGEKRPSRRAPARKSVAQAASAGSHRELLVAMRDRIAQAVTAADCPPRDLASLSRRLQEIAKEIELIDERAKAEAKDSASRPDEEWESEAL